MRISSIFPVRKGGGMGGGDGRGGGGRSSSGGKGGGESTTKGSGGGSKGAETDIPLPGSLPSHQTSAVAYGGGGGKPAVIPSGLPFAGWSSGGATRSQVYGTSYYGSGYPTVICCIGVEQAHTHPFGYWPVVYPQGPSSVGNRYPYYQSYYGAPDNTSRPGGRLMEAPFTSTRTGTTFVFVADNSTVVSVISSVAANCSSDLIAPTAIRPTAYNGTVADRKAGQAVQYYRASSAVLMLDGYNNTAALQGNPAIPPAPLPSGVDTGLLECLNDTIARGIPLMSAGVRLDASQVLYSPFSLTIIAVVIFRTLL